MVFLYYRKKSAKKWRFFSKHRPQKSDRDHHRRNNCCPFRIITDPARPEIGRFVVAARDLRPGDVIIEEPPITAGPKQEQIFKKFLNIKNVFAE
jgi:hypothetical protein